MLNKNRTYRQILKEANGKESLAFKKVYLHFWERLYIYAFKVLGNKKICEDIVQEIFLTFWKNGHKVEIENLSAYLFQSLRFQLFKHFRDKKLTKSDIKMFADVYKTNVTEDLINLNDLESVIHRHLNTLPPKCKDIFYLSRFEHLSHKEIAEKLNISTQTVKNQITTALKHLRLKLGDTYLFWLLSLLFNL
ncbi:RNA polymerase sigma factor [Flavivirga spongiicola]|uniref:RNA polymerase sigma-70 factor n=1 Tax=Flavivirga spongiicola TaxID=421621 RepID=A0ABU7XNL6_9FLAO|nr:RNA polymerase sigma-70 factor [Flavivirga sp. MEBiC05379]MDO5977359.1 RNA polymerase sigma-70 factor [Flavivirga sp. MEBiC05379]